MEPSVTTIDLGDDRVKFDIISAGISVVTLNRPQKLNALTDSMHVALRKAWNLAEADDRISAVILRGAGDRAFSSGQDLDEVGDMAPTSLGGSGRPGYPRLTDLELLSKPIVCALHGYVLGGGLELALAADIIVAADDATLGLPEVTHGMIAGAGGLFRLTRQMPPRVAMAAIMTGESFSARAAERWGLVNEVVPRADLDQAALQWAEKLVAKPRNALLAAREIAYTSYNLSLPEAFDKIYPAEIRRRQTTDTTAIRARFREPDDTSVTHSIKSEAVKPSAE